MKNYYNLLNFQKKTKKNEIVNSKNLIENFISPILTSTKKKQ